MKYLSANQRRKESHSTLPADPGIATNASMAVGLNNKGHDDMRFIATCDPHKMLALVADIKALLGLVDK